MAGNERPSFVGHHSKSRLSMGFVSFIITKVLLKLDSHFLRQSGVQGEIVPEPVMLQLQKSYQRSYLRNLIILGELKRVVQALKECSIEVVFLKGSFLAEYVYKDIACRPMGDLDILVREEDRWKSYGILKKMYYENVDVDHHTMHIHKKFIRRL